MLDRLLQDKSTGKNIIWAACSHESAGAENEPKDEITAAAVHSGIIGRRIAKESKEQAERTKNKGEVFTPAWVCNMMNNHCDEEWFGRKDVFNTQEGCEWKRSDAPADFGEKDWKEYIDSRRIEITCGEAPFLVSRYDASTGAEIEIGDRIGILDRKLRVVGENTKDEKDWLEWTYRAFQSVFGYEFQGDSLLIARINLLLTFAEYLEDKWKREPSEEELEKIADIICWNLWQMDGLSRQIPLTETPKTDVKQRTLFDEPEASEETKPAEVKCKVFDRSNNKPIYFYGEGGKVNMHFDFCIGNPPYQELTEGTRDKPVYDVFMDASYEIADKVELITPARFLFNAGATSKEWNKKMLNDPHLKVLCYAPDVTRFFTNVGFKGGVVITYRNAKDIYRKIEMFSIYPELNEILEKVRGLELNTFSEIMYGQGSYKFSRIMHIENPQIKYQEDSEGNNIGILSKGHDNDIATNALEKLSGIIMFAEKPNDGKEYVTIIGRMNNTRSEMYIRKDYVYAHPNLMKFKVLLPKANGTGAFGETLSSPIVASPGQGHTQTYLSIGCFDTEIEAQNTVKYIKSKFCRALLGILKVTQDNPPEKWTGVPLQDFTSASDIDWSLSISEIDRQLYKKYGLGDDEIFFIETNVKEML
ncbi:MAG: Eco57I restriction-modification methylase domain-containing protein [Synergistes sp.]|nr:Eco57I restriction-modification methylase domain-containing protein [Synergistes sp.]